MSAIKPKGLGTISSKSTPFIARGLGPPNIPSRRPSLSAQRRPHCANKEVSRHHKLQSQMIECDAIVDRFKSKGLAISEKSVQRALVQPEEICHDIPPPPQLVQTTRKVSHIRLTLYITEGEI
jgi:hypothetical protein